MKKYLLIFVVMPFCLSISQNLDSLYNEFIQLKGISRGHGNINVREESNPVKCSFGIVNSIKLNYEKFSPLQKSVLSPLLARPVLDTSIVSPLGYFRIHFNKSGINAPAYDIKLFAAAADSAYNYEVKIIGFPPPPKDNGAGGDDLYDIYIKDLSAEYGYTEFENSITSNTFTSYMVLDNDFAGNNYNTHGIDAARVTVAHEFNHGIQIGNYIYRQEDNYYYELTSTSMEEFVFSGVNDYYYYIKYYFQNPGRTITSNSSWYDGYDLALWNIFLKDRFGIGSIKKIWELMPSKRALQCFDDMLKGENSNFKVEFNNFALWCYFTGTRAVAGKYFSEASAYPSINPAALINSVSVNSEAASNSYFLFTDNSSSPGNALVSIISNCDIEGGIVSSAAITPFTFTVASAPISGGSHIVDKYYSKLESKNDLALSLFSQSNIFNNIPVNEGHIIAQETDYAFPQPFKYSLYNQIYFPAAATSSGYADLNIYSIDMNLVFSGSKRILATDKIAVGWDALDLRGGKLSTGVYFFITKSGDTVKKGKFVIYND